MVSASTGRSFWSSSTDATFPARPASSAVRHPTPGPISSTPQVLSAREQGEIPRRRAGEEILSHGLGEVEAVPGQKGPEGLPVAEIHGLSAFPMKCQGQVYQKTGPMERGKMAGLAICPGSEVYWVQQKGGSPHDPDC